MNSIHRLITVLLLITVIGVVGMERPIVRSATEHAAGKHHRNHQVDASVPDVFTSVSFSLTNQEETGSEPVPQVFLPLILRSEIVVPPDATPILPTATPTPILPTATPMPILPTATPTPILPPPSFVSCAVLPDAASAPHYPIKIVTVDKQAESVTLQNMTTTEHLDLTSWTMCSIRGGQTHRGISGTLAPGETRIFIHTGGNIWNNTESDPGALYDPDGRLISFWAD